MESQFQRRVVDASENPEQGSPEPKKSVLEFNFRIDFLLEKIGELK